MHDKNDSTEEKDFVPDTVAHRILSVWVQITTAGLIFAAVAGAYYALSGNDDVADKIAYIAAALGVFNLLNTSTIAYIERRMRPSHSAGRLKKLESDYERLNDRLKRLEKRIQ